MISCCSPSQERYATFKLSDRFLEHNEKVIIIAAQSGRNNYDHYVTKLLEISLKHRFCQFLVEKM